MTEDFWYTVLVMDVTRIKDRRLSDLIAAYWICAGCGCVDGNESRAKPGHRCRQCGGSFSRPADRFFQRNICSLIDLMQEFFHIREQGALNFDDSAEYRRNGRQLVIVILFCTLMEVLFENFLKGCMAAMTIPSHIQERLLRDNLYMHQRVKRLFPTLTGSTWSRSVSELGKRRKQNYPKTARLYEKAAEARNQFLHRGGAWTIPSGIPEQCLRQTKPLLELFVDLHNEFVSTKPAGKKTRLDTGRNAG